MKIHWQNSFFFLGWIHNAASEPFAGIAGLEALGVAAESQVVSFFMNNECFADDEALAGAIQRYCRIENMDIGYPIGAC